MDGSRSRPTPRGCPGLPVLPDGGSGGSSTRDSAGDMTELPAEDAAPAPAPVPVLLCRGPAGSCVEASEAEGAGAPAASASEGAVMIWSGEVGRPPTCVRRI